MDCRGFCKGKKWTNWPSLVGWTVAIMYWTCMLLEIKPISPTQTKKNQSHPTVRFTVLSTTCLKFYLSFVHFSSFLVLRFDCCLLGFLGKWSDRKAVYFALVVIKVLNIKSLGNIDEISTKYSWKYRWSIEWKYRWNIDIGKN